MKLFLDLDGVLADFDEHYFQSFGIRPNKRDDAVDWSLIDKADQFYLNLPPMPDLDQLWAFCEPLKPTILTGIPWSVPNVETEKRQWVAKHLGSDVKVVCCRSRDKCLHAMPGDVLVDDWEKYRHVSEDFGGVWITHRSAAETIRELRQVGFNA